ncbi:MAG: DUF4292 domain-containing protein [Pseudobdellovibrio sp.]
MNKEKSFFLYLNLLVLCPVLFLTGCSSEPQVEIPVEAPRVYETKAQIKSNGETNTVKIQIALAPQKMFRLEITGTLGVSVASVLVNPKQIKMALHLQKTYIEGPFNQKTLYPVFKQNISARLLWKIVHDQNPADANWKCEVNEAGKPTSCRNEAEATDITWTYEDPIHKRIDIKNNTFEMNWIFKDQLQMPEFQNETFVLKKPEGYKEILIK